MREKKYFLKLLYPNLNLLHCKKGMLVFFWFEVVERGFRKDLLLAYWEDWFDGIEEAFGVWSSENNGFLTSISPVVANPGHSYTV